MAVDTSSFPEQVKAAIENGSYTADDLIVTSKISGQKMSWLDYFNEIKSGAVEAEGDAPAAPTGTAPTPAASAEAAAAAPVAAATVAPSAATAAPEAAGRPDYYPYVEVEQMRMTAQTVTLRKVTRPSGIPDTDRRGFFGWALMGWAAFAAAMGMMQVALGRFMFPNVLFEPPSSFTIGFPDQFDIGFVETKFKAMHGVWIIRNEEGIYALSTICTHLGCTPNWLNSDQKFKCPCHGSGFRKTGINFEGPAPRPLERFRIVLAEDGQILVDKSKKYQFEKGQWDDPDSLLIV